MDESGLSGSDLRLLDEELRVRPDHLHHEVNRLFRAAVALSQSEPENYPCLPARKWGQLFEDDYGHDYACGIWLAAIVSWKSLIAGKLSGTVGQAANQSPYSPVEERWHLGAFGGDREDGIMEAHGSTTIANIA
ncbi:MAG: hypothetical protein U0361_01925 [Nitrospiraceae bacterium]